MRIYANGKIVDKDNPLPVSGSFVDANGNPLFSSSNPGNVQLSGRNVEKSNLVMAHAIADTSIYRVDIDPTKYQQIDFIITNTTDQTLWIAFNRMNNAAIPLIKADDKSKLSYYTDSAGSSRKHEVPSGIQELYLSMLPFSDTTINLPFRTLKHQVKLQYRMAATPTSGSVTIDMVGVPY